MKNKIIVLMFVYLIVSLPFGLAQATREPLRKDLDTGRSINATIKGTEIGVEFIGPTSRRDIEIDRNLTISGGDVFSGDFVINVERYEPTVLTSGLVEEGNTPVYAFISGRPLLFGGISSPKIRSMSLTVIGGDTKFVGRAPKWNPPTVFTEDNLGYIETWLRRIPMEEDVPSRIDLRLRAKIRYEGDVTTTVFGGREVKRLKESRRLDIFEEGGFVDPQYSIFGNRGYVRIGFVRDRSAIFYVYGSDGVLIRSVEVGLGQESEVVNLFPQTQFSEDAIRVRLDRIIREDEDFVEFKIGKKTLRYNEFDRYGISGGVGDIVSDFTGLDLGNYNIYESAGISGSSWVVEEIFIPERGDESFKFVGLLNIDTESRVVLIEGEDENFMRDWYKKFYEKENIDDVTSKDMLIKTLRDSVNVRDNKELSDDLKEQGIRSSEAARFLFNKMITASSPAEADRKISELFTRVKESFKGEDGEFFFPLARKISGGENEGAVLRVGSSIPDTFFEGDDIGKGVYCEDDQNKKYYCEVTSVDVSRALITRFENRDGKCVARESRGVNLNSDVLRLRRGGIISREGGTQDIPQNTGRTAERDILESSFCGVPIEFVDIETNREVIITILAGGNLGISEAVFDLHIPIEKRAIKLAPEKLDDKINATKELIDDLDDMIDKLERFVGGWAKVCLGVSAWFTLEAFLVGVPKYKQSQGERDSSYTKSFNDEYTFKLNSDEEIKINGIEDGEFYSEEDGKKTKLVRVPPSAALYRNDIAYEYDPGSGEFVPKKSLNEEKNAASVRKLPDGRQEIFFGTGNREDTKTFMRRISDEKFANELDEKLKPFGDQGFYVVFREGEYGKVCQKRGEEVDGGERYGGDSDVDNCFAYFPKTGASALDRNIYGRMENEFRTIRRAQLQGRQSAFFGGKNFRINNLGGVPETDLKCEDVLGSKEKCKILFNACDPVVCPRSRCNLGGQYQNTGPSGVIGSGLVGSLVLCLPNIQENRGQVLVPVCLSGILASLKGIRSHLDSYVSCLENQKINGISTGICDQMRSIYICSFIWKEALTLLAAKGSLINFFGKAGGGGGEYFSDGVGGSLREANEVSSFLINDYADDVFSAYRGKGLPEIGGEVCKASIAQRIPFMDAFVQEFATPDNPPQFTAYFEENPFAPTLGKAQYKVYYHIYAGTPRRDIGLQYLIYLKSFGSSPRIIISSGSLGSGESADESIEMVADSGYQEICVVLNGLEQCGFGKIVSSSFLLSTMDDYLTSLDLSRDINSVEQCKTDATVPVTYTLTTGALPFARIKRVCSTTNPGVGFEEERYWRRVGSCGENERGVSLGNCYAFADTREFSETERQALENTCGGEVCRGNQQCMDGDEPGKVTYKTTSGSVCCERGRCVIPESAQIARSIGDQTISDVERRNQLDKFKFNTDGSIRSTGEEFNRPNTDEDWFFVGSRACSNGEYVKCKNLFDNIDKDIAPELYAKSRYILGLNRFEKDKFEDSKSLLEEAKSGGLDGSDLDKLEEVLEKVKTKLAEEAARREEEKAKLEQEEQDEESKNQEEKEQILIDEKNEKIKDEIDNNFLPKLNQLITYYNAFTSVRDGLNDAKNTLSLDLESSPPDLFLNEVNNKLKNIVIKDDLEYTIVMGSFGDIKGNIVQYEFGDTTQSAVIINKLGNILQAIADWPQDVKNEIGLHVNNAKGVASNFNDIGNLKIFVGRAEDAVPNLERVLDEFTEEIDVFLNGLNDES